MMNKKLKLLIFSDILILSSFGLIAPIFAIFILGLEGGSIIAAGLATTIFWVVRSSVQLPLSRYLIDKHRFKTKLLLVGTFLIVTVPFIYIVDRNVYVIFFAQAVYGLGAALAYPSWFSLFTTYLDKRQKGFQYSVWNTGVGLGVATAAFFGATIAETFGFVPLFIFVGLMALSGFFIIIALDKIEMKEYREKEKIRKQKEREKKKRRKAMEKAKRRKAMEKAIRRKKREFLKLLQIPFLI